MFEDSNPLESMGSRSALDPLRLAKLEARLTGRLPSLPISASAAVIDAAGGAPSADTNNSRSNFSEEHPEEDRIMSDPEDGDDEATVDPPPPSFAALRIPSPEARAAQAVLQQAELIADAKTEPKPVPLPDAPAPDALHAVDGDDPIDAMSADLPSRPLPPQASAPAGQVSGQSSPQTAATARKRVQAGAPPSPSRRTPKRTRVSDSEDSMPAGEEHPALAPAPLDDKRNRKILHYFQKSSPNGEQSSGVTAPSAQQASPVLGTTPSSGSPAKSAQSPSRVLSRIALFGAPANMSDIEWPLSNEDAGHAAPPPPVATPAAAPSTGATSPTARSTMESQLVALRTERDRLEKELAAQMARVADVRAEAERRIERIEVDFVSRSRKSVQAVADLLRREAEAAAKEARRVTSANCFRLATLRYVRQGSEFAEVWQDGAAIQEAAERLLAIQGEKDEIEKNRKTVASKRKAVSKERTPLARPFNEANSFNLDARGGAAPTASPSSGDVDEDGFVRPRPVSGCGGASSSSEDALTEEDEVLKWRLAALKREEADLLTAQESLERERDLHIREMRRQQQENQSRFNGFPILSSRYLLLSLLGRGGFSEVFKAYDLLENDQVACKIHQLNPQWSEDKKANYTKHAVREYNIHKALSHPRIVKLRDVFEIDDNSFCTVLEHCDGGDLDQQLRQHRMLGEKEAKHILVQVMQGLRHLNEVSPPIIHYDLKPGNILLHQGRIKITDFGLSKIVEQTGAF